MLRVLAIETSCDETAAAVVEGDGTAPPLVRSNTLASQAALHTEFGGVFPEMAAREHAKRIVPVIGLALHEAGLLADPQLRGEPVQRALGPIDAIAVTVGPGLIGPLLIGTTAAAQLANLAGKPIIPINHWEGHLYSVFLPSPVIARRETTKQSQEIATSASGRTRDDDNGTMEQWNNRLPAFPILFLTVSGGHTSLILMKDHFRYEILGSTVDDAAGEAFDKCARMLGLGYPGGAALSKAALAARTLPIRHLTSVRGEIRLPRPMLKSGDLRFSFSGLKTAVRYAIDRGDIRLPDDLAIAAAAIEDAIVDVLLAKLSRAIEEVKPASVAIVGGVSANQELRRRAASELAIPNSHFPILLPHGSYTTDNAAMIAAAGLFRFVRNEGVTTFDHLSANASLRLGKTS